MAGESQYFNPIIQSMIAAQQQNQERAKLQQQADQFKADQAIREHQLKIHETQVGHEYEHQKGMLEIAQQQHQAELAQRKLELLKFGRDLSLGGYSGIDINKALSSVPQLGGGVGPQSQAGGTPPGGTPPAPSASSGNGMEIPTIDPAAALAAEANRVRTIAGAQTEGQLKAAEPFKISEEERAFTSRKQLQDYENAFKSGLADKEIASKEKLAKLERDTQVQLNNATNATHLKVAGMQYTPSPETTKQMVVAFATGQAKPNLANPVERAAWTSAQEMGFRGVDPKEAAALREGQQLLPLFDKLETFAKKLPSTRVGAAVQGQVLGAEKKLGYTSETQNDLNNILSQALVVGRNVEGLTGGRVLSKQLELDLNSIASGGISKDDAMARLNNLKDLYVNKQENMLMGGMSNAQKDLIRNTYGIKTVSAPNVKPDFLKLAPKTNSAGHTLDEEMSIKLGKPVYAGQ